MKSSTIWIVCRLSAMGYARYSNNRETPLASADNLHASSNYAINEVTTGLKADKICVDNWREKQATRDTVKMAIYNFLWDDTTGLPIDVYSQEEVETKTDLVYQHIFIRYQDAEHHVYA